MNRHDYVSLVIVVTFVVAAIYSLLESSGITPSAVFVAPDIFASLFIAFAVLLLEYNREFTRAMQKNADALEKTSTLAYYYATVISMISTVVGLSLSVVGVHGIVLLGILYAAVAALLVLAIRTVQLMLP